MQHARGTGGWVHGGGVYPGNGVVQTVVVPRDTPPGLDRRFLMTDLGTFHDFDEFS